MNLDKIKSFFPDFKMCDFNMFEQITLLKWEPVFDNDTWEEHKNLFLEMTSADNCKITLECIDVEYLSFRGNGQILGFYIKDMSARGYENCSKYEVGDYEEECIECYCTDIVIKNFEKVQTITSRLSG